LGALLPTDGIHTPEVSYTDDGVLTFKIGAGTSLPIDSLSDGYKSLVGMAVDIMQVMHSANYSSMLTAQGVVIIDELGNHFHPSWKMKIVSALREAFPKIQFIFSTHEPLCLRGLRDKEIAVLKRDRLGKVYALTNLPSITSLRVDQILTSEHFGLGTTVDPSLEAAIQLYEDLAKKLPRSEQEEAQFIALEKQLSDVRYLGNTRRERLLLKLIDAELDEQPSEETGVVDADEISEQALRRIRRVLDEFRR
jgi:predicted ATP-binding protein involved in virulence